MHGFLDRGSDVPRGRFSQTGRFGRLFPELRTLKSFAPGPHELGKVGGPMDGGSPPPTDPSQDNPRIKAGYTFLGQFIDHDLTLDVTSVLEQQVDLGATHNFRTPALELDSLYGLGPLVQPYLYDQTKPFRFLLGTDNEDLPRNSQGRALIGDPRNDENAIIAQLHLLMLKFHNRVFDWDGIPDSVTGLARFEAAQRIVRWHYQWIVLREFLPRTIGTKTAGRLRDTPQWQFPGEAFMPVEFSVAAYRLGHSQVRPGYGLRPGAGAALFPASPTASPDTHLAGGRALLPALRVDWDRFFGTPAQPSKLLDTRISSTLLNLPDGVVPLGTPSHFRSLATRNLQRGLDLHLPSGQDVAFHLGTPNPISESDIWDGVAGGKGGAPLWFYVLREAEKRGAGHRLTGVGAEIVGRVFVAILLADKASYLHQRPDWTPELPSANAGTFTMTDLVNFTIGTNIPGEDLQKLPGDDV